MHRIIAVGRTQHSLLYPEPQYCHDSGADRPPYDWIRREVRCSAGGLTRVRGFDTPYCIMQIQTESQALPSPAPNPLLGLVSIFYAPAETFEARTRRPWLVPLVAATLLALLLNIMI